MRIDALEIADQVNMQRAGFQALHRIGTQAAEVGGRVGALEVAKSGLFFQQFLCIAHAAVQENAHPQAQIVHQTVVQFGDLQHAGFRKISARPDFFIFNIDQYPLDDVTDLLHVDHKANDVCPAAAFFFSQCLP